VILEGLRLMKGRGMTTAMVCAEADNLPAQKLYEIAGFRAIKKIVTYSRRLSYDSQRT
jgi:ribosomal protein S18 acetylase RimI-like enzyme